MSDSVRPKDLRPDPWMTGFAVQYGSGGGFVADQIAPVFNVAAREFQYPIFKSEGVASEFESRVPASGRPNEIRRMKPTYLPGLAHRYALDDSLSDETRLGSLPQFTNLTSDAGRIKRIVTNLRLDADKRVRDLVVAATHSATPAVKWDAASGVVIEKNFDDARILFELQCGVPATHVILPKRVKNWVKRDASVRELRKYTDPTLLIDGDLPPVLWGLKPIVPGAMLNTGNPDVAMTIGLDFIWGAKEAYLLHVNMDAANSQDVLTAIGQMRWGAYGTPFAGYSWRDAHQSAKKTWYSADVYQSEKTLCDDAMYKFTAVIS
ncbi:MAG: hypothetical protein ABIT01_19545 [Thermoanaerobaculia bacterium]